MDRDYHETAVIHYRQALDLNPENWFAMIRIACSSAEQWDKLATIEWLLRALDALPANQRSFQGRSRINIWSDAAPLMDDSASYRKVVLMILEQDQNDVRNVEKFACEVGEARAFDTLMEGLQSLTDINGDGITKLAEFSRLGD